MDRRREQTLEILQRVQGEVGGCRCAILQASFPRFVLWIVGLDTGGWEFEELRPLQYAYELK